VVPIRHMLRIQYASHVSSSEVRARTGQPCTSHHTRQLQRRLKLFVRVARTDQATDHSRINFLVLSVNLISAPLSLSFLFMLLPLLLTLSTHHSHHPSLPLSFTPGSRPISFTNLSHHRLPSDLRTNSTDFTTGPLLLSISVLRFF